MARSISIPITGNAAPLRQALADSESSISAFSRRATSSFADFGRKAAAGVAVAGGAVAGFIGKGLTDFAGFQQGLNEVFTLLPNAGQDTFDKLTEQTKTFAKEFGVLPDDVIPSLYSALSAGVPTDNVFEFLEVAQQAAKGGVTDLETAVDGISSVVNAYGDDVISAAEASDLMFTAVRLGKTTFDELSGSLYNVAPIASSLGVDFDVVTAALANLTAQGTPTSVAATQLRSAFSELGKEGTKADEAFRELAGVGFTEFLDSGGTVLDAFTMLNDAAIASGGSLLDTFGSIEAGQAVLGLVSDGGEAFAATLDEMSNSAGATEAAFDTMDTGLASSFDKIKANLSVLMIEIGERFAPIVERALTFVVDHFDDFVATAESGVELVRKGFNKMRPTLEKVFDVMRDIAVEIGKRLGPVLERIGRWIKANQRTVAVFFGIIAGAAVLAGIVALGAAIAALFNPVTLVVGAIALIGAGLFHAWENSETFRNVVTGVFDAVKTAVVAVKDAFEDNFAKIKAAFEIVRDALEPVFDFIGDRFQNIVDIVSGVVKTIKGIFTGDLSTVLDGLKQAFGGAVDYIIGLFVELPVKLITELGKLLGKLSLWFIFDGAPAFLEGAAKLGGAIVDGIIAGLKALIGFAGGVADVIADAVFDAIKWTVNTFVISPLNAAIGKAMDLIDVAAGPFINFDDEKYYSLIPKLADGGIVTGPTLALIGEAGPEAVVPLDGRHRMGGDMYVTVNMPAGSNGDELLRQLQRLARERGELPLATSTLNRF